ncbi:cytochrome c biogenesis protein [Mariniblastus fucicola]|uniref:Cytochrome c biogenesis protein CcsA n=1 Tax=Mariniblastus fucicola TaxID=980251 RepID=A0A5B9PFJ5_9BACT|nr:cytochrome c biogenesis protein CcsA [Mariniblastus fucicola]QEG23965.1 Cytochrome c biogenesis protein CcsA [Mariniblastus fucicola]
MATNSLPTKSGTAANRHGELSATDIATAIIAPLASLKLTVFLLFTAIAVVFIATLQQASMDMWSVKNMHYDNWFVTIPFQALLIERWFPGFQDVPGSFVIPSGKLIIYGLIINLVAAHLLRFRIKAKGVKLWIGLVTAVIAGVVTWAMSFNTFGTDGFQKAPPVSYSQMWLIMQVILLGLALSCVAGMFLTEKGKRIEKSILGIFAFLAAAVLMITIGLGKDAFIGDSGMRILWQLAQSTIAACVAWGACVLLFHRKAGIVLLHLGVVGLMANELYVTYTNEETRMQFVEGESTSVATDIRATEFVILDQSDPEFDEMVAIPESMLKSGELIQDERLPFSIRCLKFYDNARVDRASAPNKDIKGMGRMVDIVELPPSVSDQVDFAAARIELLSKSGESLGTWKVSQMLREFADTVSVGDKDYRIGLRFKSEYKPYALKLNDVKAEYYTGTSTPKWFSSNVELVDLETNSSSEHEIWMNNPLRYDGETFYQASYDASGGEEMSALQVVKNRGWMIPYICCMFTVVGLAGQFGSSLLAWLKKNKAQTESKLEKDDSGRPIRKRFNWKSPAFLVPSGIAAIFALYAMSGLSKSARPVVHESGMRLDRFGEIPITNKGRIQPLDSFARNTARQFSKREFVYDKDLTKQPAIRWLADTMFEADGYDEFRLFRIEDLEILDSLDLPKEAGAGEPKDVRFRYTLKQLEKAPPKLFSALPEPGTPESMWSPYQSRAQKHLGRIQQTLGLSAIVADTTDSASQRLDRQRGKMAAMLGDRPFPINPERWPRFIPKGNEWSTLSDADNRRWLIEKATDLESETVMGLYPKLLESSDSLRDYRLEESSTVLDQVDLKKLLFTPDRIDAAEKEGAKTPEEITSSILSSPAAQRVRLMAFNESDRLINSLLANMNGDENEISTSGESIDVQLSGLFQKMGVAYRAGDADTFNSLTEEYLGAVQATSEVSGFLSRMKAEKVYNGWSPFYVSMVLYLIAFVAVAFSWFMSFDQNFSKIFGRTAIAIVLIALLVQMIGLVFRVYISGRPPVTNLYSSALFVSAVFVAVMLLVEAITRLGVGTAMGSIGAFGALLWAWTMSIVDGDTFSVLVAVLDTQFWLSTHVVCITIGYGVTFGAGFLAVAYVLISMFTPALDKNVRRQFSSIIYGITCFALFFSFFGTVLGGLWGDDSWGRFWGWDPKENGALMIVLWSALLLHARWGGLVKERGIAILAILGNIVVLWSWKGVNSMGVGLHAYAGSEDSTVFWIVFVGAMHLVVAAVALTPTKFWYSHIRHAT